MFHYSSQQLQDKTQWVIEQAKKQGASDCVVEVSESLGLEVQTRNLELENIEKTHDQSLSLTVYLGNQENGFCRASCSSSDFSEQSLHKLIEGAMAIAQYTQADLHAGLAESHIYANDAIVQKNQQLQLHQTWNDLTIESAISMAQEMEQIGLNHHLISQSEGAGVHSSEGHFWLANSVGFSGGYAFSRHSLSANFIAGKDEDAMQSGGYYHSTRHHQDLESPQTIGTKAVQDTVEKLNPQTIKSGTYPVLFSNELSCGLLGSFAYANNGSLLYRQETFIAQNDFNHHGLCGLQHQFFPSDLNIWQDNAVVRGLGSSYFDDEGVATSYSNIIENGKLQHHLLNIYTSRKMNETYQTKQFQTTGNAGGSHNLYWNLVGKMTDNPLEALGTGVYVTSLMGQGVNYLNGDYSRGASGFWVENGKIMFPIEEITIAGNLLTMYHDIIAMGTNTVTMGAKNSGSVLIKKMTVAS